MERRIMIQSLAGLMVAQAGGAAQNDLAGAFGPWLGVWSGALDLGSQRLRLRLDIRSATEVFLYSLDQGNEAIPATRIELRAGTLTLAFASIKASFVGTLDADVVSGTFKQGGSLKLVLARGEQIAELAPPPVFTRQSIEALRAKAGLAGLAAGVLSPGAEAEARARVLATGSRALGAAAPIQPDDLWHIGSITKSFTGLLVARLAEQGVISWDDEVGQVLVPVPGLPAMQPGYAKANFRHLLSHGAGLHANIGLVDFLRFRRRGQPDLQERRRFAALALAQPPQSELGKPGGYSNNGYIVAGAMLEARLGQSWEALMATHVFGPLGLKRAGFGPPGPPKALDQPHGHSPGLFGKLQPRDPGDGFSDNPLALGPAGRMHLPLDELLAVAGHHARRSSFLQRASWDILHTPPFGGSYAMGLVVRSDGMLWHNGSNTMWYAEMLIDPASGRVAVAATNDGRTGLVEEPVGQALRAAFAAG